MRAGTRQASVPTGLGLAETRNCSYADLLSQVTQPCVSSQGGICFCEFSGRHFWCGLRASCAAVQLPAIDVEASTRCAYAHASCCVGYLCG